MLDNVIDSVLIRKHSKWRALKIFFFSEVGVIVIKQSDVN